MSFARGLELNLDRKSGGTVSRPTVVLNTLDLAKFDVDSKIKFPTSVRNKTGVSSHEA
jgi:hypothetical protein